MKVIVDTHAFLWFITANPKLSETAKSIIQNPENIRFISNATYWEIAIKSSLNKLFLHKPFETLFAVKGFHVLKINPQHLIRLHSLKFFHKDPFDRLIISQALTENMAIISKDSEFKQYGVDLIW